MSGTRICFGINKDLSRLFHQTVPSLIFKVKERTNVIFKVTLKTFPQFCLDLSNNNEEHISKKCVKNGFK